jgi:hypothetical protein
MSHKHRPSPLRLSALFTLVLTLLILPLQTASADLREQRPFSDNSPWNTPIAAGAAADRHSTEMIATLKATQTGGAITSDPNQYSYPVYFVDKTTPRWDIPCTSHKCTVVTEAGAQRTDVLRNVPLPANALASTGSDGQIIVIDQESGTEYDLWQVQRSATGWTVSNGSTYNIAWDAAPREYGSRGAGVPYYAGLIRPWEIEAGEIGHALAFAYPTPARDRCVYPASKTDGRGDGQFAIPEGARLQLDPSLTDEDFRRWGLDRTGIIIARALQRYGMYLIDISGRPKIIAENLKDNPYASRQWSDPALNLTDQSIAAIPPDAFHVLALPDAYWDASLSGSVHGECLRQGIRLSEVKTRVYLPLVRRR